MTGNGRITPWSRRLGRTVAGAAALAALGAVAGCGEDSPPEVPEGGPAVEPCVTASGELVADLDADGLADRVLDPSGAGTGLRIRFGAESGEGPEAGAGRLVGGSGEDETMAAVADFDGDGWFDLVAVATGEWQGDDPIEPRVAELRFGPFSREGRGQRSRELDLGETRGIAVADYNHDRYPDLAAFVYAGDGVYETEARLGEAEDGLGELTGEILQEYTVMAEQTGDPTPRNMPEPGLPSFLPACEESGG
ncbi:FG-GAP repeat domain-containing protein [Streptomyces hoynatensis]|uniref:VCBS repeat-containing protein n=1 Tax=Streptomyces hoynatensis TaxID=1141874 RepID=A0A3A9Z053_9ACTN|nr:VCBS repeat-containing protein [Streptomyces hoynatensis]RKN41314.1 VCBS repeat-containing protein [Streptomyces hoynatensis]